MVTLFVYTITISPQKCLKKSIKACPHGKIKKYFLYFQEKVDLTKYVVNLLQLKHTDFGSEPSFFFTP